MTVDSTSFFQELDYNPHPGQLLYHQSAARFRVAVCGRRYGKSTMSGRDIQPKLFVPFSSFWIAGPTYDLAEKEFRVIWDDLIVKKRLGRDKETKTSFNKKGGTMFIEFPWRTRIECRSATHPESLVGEGLDGIIMSEAAKHKRETWERFVRPALADKRGFADFPTTPEGQNWIYELWKYGQDPGMPDYESWRMPSWENTEVYPGGRNDPEILLLERTTDPDWFDQEIGAKFTSFVGKIYAEFDDSVHVRDLEFNPAWPNYIAWDWGYVNPLAAIEFQVTPQDEIRIWREHYRTHLTLDEHFKIMRERPQPDGYHITNTFGDSADPAAVQEVNQKFAPCIALPEAKTNWREGVDLVKSFLMDRETGDTDEYGAPFYKPGLLVDRHCRHTISEFHAYKRRDGVADAKESGTTSPVVKKDDHAMDAIRYGLMHLFKLGVDYHLDSVMTPTIPSATPEPVVPVGAGFGDTRSSFFDMNMDF